MIGLQGLANFITRFYNIAEPIRDIVVCLCVCLSYVKRCLSVKTKIKMASFYPPFQLFFFYYLWLFCVVFFCCFFLIYFSASYSLCHILQIKQKIQLCHCNHKDALTALFSKGKMMLVSWFFCLLQYSLNKKVEVIVDVFLDSASPPWLQVTVFCPCSINSLQKSSRGN